MRLSQPGSGRKNMLDINYIKENLDKVRKSVEDRKLNVDLDRIIELDNKRKEFIKRIDEKRAERNAASKEKPDQFQLEHLQSLKQNLEKLEPELKKIEDELKNLMLGVPNVPIEGVPEGDASNNKILRQEGNLPKFEFTPKDHVALGELLDIIDIPRAAKVSGTRFGYLKNEGALLEFALVQLALKTLVEDKFIPVVPPALIRKEITEGLGYWHGKIDEKHTANENYYLVSDPEEHKEGLYLIGTGEHAVVPMHSDEVLDEKELPKKYVAFSPCFRREAGSYGKDTKGILRVHQFDKVEMVEFVKPEEDEKQRRKMLAIVEGLMQSLGLPYQVVQLAAGDLSFPGAETIDIETWIPSQGKYRETHSISTTTDFQSRRLNIRYSYVDAVTHKPSNPVYPGQIESGFFQKQAYVHILNGTAFAVGRMIIALLENNQQEDGSVKIPEVLQKYTGFSEINLK